MPHHVLLGDSIFDNVGYVLGGKDVRGHLLDQLARVQPYSRVTLLALDGAVCADVADQLNCLPSDADQLFLSIGGNDLLREIDLLEQRSGTVGRALVKVDEMLNEVFVRYSKAVESCLETRLPLCLCAVYGGSLPDTALQPCVDVVVALFHDRIRRLADMKGVPVIDLRRVCCEPLDYVQSIEPSDVGGRKIAAALAEFLVGQQG